jgi:hypothetical protein
MPLVSLSSIHSRTSDEHLNGSEHTKPIHPLLEIIFLPLDIQMRFSEGSESRSVAVQCTRCHDVRVNIRFDHIVQFSPVVTKYISINQDYLDYSTHGTHLNTKPERRAFLTAPYDPRTRCCRSLEL